MALTKEITQDKIEIVGPHKFIQVRTKTAVLEDGAEISASFSRHVVHPNDDVAGESDEVKAIVAAMHTDAIVAAYEASQAEEE